jgi:hypothetical protein
MCYLARPAGGLVAFIDDSNDVKSQNRAMECGRGRKERDFGVAQNVLQLSRIAH